MKRLQLVELEDQPWVPRLFRDGATDVLDVFLARSGIYRPLAPALTAFMRTAGFERWLDLCSGGGGGALVMRAEIAAEGGKTPSITLTDRYPNEAARQRIAALGDPGVRYCATPVDALNVGPQTPAIRTMFSALHHFPPDQVRHILQAAVADGAPLAFVDIAASPAVRRVPVALAPIVALPNVVLVFLMALALVPLVRPFRWSRLLFTYVLPAIPLLFAWDGTVSAMRAYAADELLAIARTVPGASSYRWDVVHRGNALMLTGNPASQ